MKKIVIILLILFPAIAFSQNVGIGTTTPGEKLEIKNPLRSTVKISSGGLADTTQLIFSNIGSTAGSYTDFSIKSIAENGLFFSSNSDLAGNTSSNSLVIRPGGNIGLGINVPVYRLQVNEPVAASTYMSLTNPITGSAASDGLVLGLTGNSGILYNLENSSLQLGTNGNTRLMIEADGDVGIGTISPTAKLHIIGGVKLEGLNLFEFGANVAGKEVNAGKIGYNAFGTSALAIVGAGTTSSNRAVYFFAEGGTTFSGPATILGNTNMTGQLQLNGSPGTTGQVLASNGTSDPTWQSVANPQTGFNAESAINQTLAQFAQTKINFTTEIFDDGSDYNNATSTFVAPATGVYHFDANVTFFDADPGTYRLFLDNNTSIADGEYARSYYQVSDLGSTTIRISITLKLTVGASVLVHAWHGAVANQSVIFAYFTSHRVY